MLASHRDCLALTSVLMFWASPALSGPHAGGTLILHACPPCYTDSDIQDYCGIMPLTRCQDALTTYDGDFVFPLIWYVYAALPENAFPRLKGTTFGIDYDETTVFLLGWGPCADFELTTNGWPAPGEGTAVTWNDPLTQTVNEIYWFAGYEYYGQTTSFDLIGHPTQGAMFADDSIPALLDPAADLGRLGFNGDPGYLPCPAPSPEGACCLPDDSCLVLPEFECLHRSGRPMGAGVPCEPNPCQPVPTSKSSWGEVKLRYR